MDSDDTMKNIKCVEGFAKVFDSKANLLEGRGWIDKLAWRRYFKKAWQIKMAGGMFVEWQSGEITAEARQGDNIVFVWDMGLGSFADSAQPTGEYQIQVNGKRALSFCTTGVSRCWEKDDFRFYFEVKRRDNQCAFGLGYFLVPLKKLEAQGSVKLKISASDTLSDRWFMLCEYGEGCLVKGISFNEPNAAATFTADGIAAISRGRQKQTCDDMQLYWGDLHVHSSMANYLEHTPEQNYEYGRYVS